jgi:hypothetical protein
MPSLQWATDHHQSICARDQAAASPYCQAGGATTHTTTRPTVVQLTGQALLTFRSPPYSVQGQGRGLSSSGSTSRRSAISHPPLRLAVARAGQEGPDTLLGPAPIEAIGAVYCAPATASGRLTALNLRRHANRSHMVAGAGSAPSPAFVSPLRPACLLAPARRRRQPSCHLCRGRGQQPYRADAA